MGPMGRTSTYPIIISSPTSPLVDLQGEVTLHSPWSKGSRWGPSSYVALAPNKIVLIFIYSASKAEKQS
jgi:hypothetical protein